ncbi:MAG: MMPL family transporter [Fuerstiella sp.]|nr:MMPL family transporter [Fuerstiella sp.]
MPFLQRRDRWGHGVSLWIVAFIVFLLPVMIRSLHGLRLHNDVAGWLPKNDPQARILAWYEGLFPSKDRILVAWDDASLTDPRLKLLKERLEGMPVAGDAFEGGSPYVSEVRLPADALIRMLSKDIPFEEALDRIDGVLSGRGPLRIRFTDAGRSRGEYLEKEILRLANDQFGLQPVIGHAELTLPSSEGISLEDTGAWRLHEELTAYVQNQPLYDLQLSWPGMHSETGQLGEFSTALMSMEAPGSGSQTAGKSCIEECFITPGSLAALSVSLSEAGVADKKAAVAAVRSAVESIGVPAETVRLGGQPVVNVALNQAVADAAWNRNQPAWNLPKSSPIALSAFVSILLSFVMLRSFRLATLVQAVSFLTVIIAVAVVPLTGTSMNMVLIVMPTLLIVLTTSAAIHLANYWKHSGDSDPGRSVFRAAETAWLPCALASGTTAIGLASLLASNLVPVRDFGIYSAIGCIISFVIVLYVLPSLMLYWPKSPPPTHELETGHWNRFGLWIAHHRHLVSATCVAATLGAGWGLQYFDTETKVIRYFPSDSQLVQDYVFLEDKLSGVISIDTIVKFDEMARQTMPFIERARLVMALQSDVRKHPEISGVLSLASFLDLREADTRDMSMGQRFRLKRTQSALEGKIHRRIKAKGSDNDEISSLLALPDYSTDWLEDGDELLNRQGDEVWRVTAQTSALSSVDLEVLTQEIDAIASNHLASVGSPYTGHVVTGLIPVFLRTQQAVLESLIRSFGMAFIVIAVVMMIVLRSPMAGVFTMLPNLMPVVLVFGLLSWMRLKVDIGTMITASVALGIAVDGTLHLLTWFQELVRRGMPVDRAVGKALEHCGPAMWQTSAAVGLGMLALLPADLLLVSRFGWIMAALIFAALVADVIFLPALLGGLLGRLIQQATCRHFPDVGVSIPPEDGHEAAMDHGAAMDHDDDDMPMSALKDVS